MLKKDITNLITHASLNFLYICNFCCFLSKLITLYINFYLSSKLHYYEIQRDDSLILFYEVILTILEDF